MSAQSQQLSALGLKGLTIYCFTYGVIHKCNPPHLGLAQWCGPPSSPSLRRPLRHPPPVDPAFSLGQAAGGDHRRKPPEACTAMDATAGSPQHHGRLPGPGSTAGPRLDSHASCRPPRQPSCHQAGLILRPAGISTIEA